MNFPVWRVEWRLALRRRRVFAMNMAIPLLLVLPLAMGAAPPYHAAAVYAVLFVLFGVMGTAIPFLRDSEADLLRRIAMCGLSARRLLAQRVGAGAVLDGLQLLPALVLILALGAGPGGAWLFLPVALATALLAAAAVGTWVAALARSLAEGALLAAVTTLFLLHGAGVFRRPAPGGWGEWLASVLPFGPLHRGLQAAAIGGGTGLPPWSELLPGMTLTTVGIGLTLGAAPFLVRRITTQDS
jgi:ABC-type transport system involved in cytochrome c biogenesis permease component